jgi:DNA (cytosine-5)-methyltransferase 1
MTELRFIDLFAGIGGMRLGFQTIGAKCVFTSEWDKYAQKTYRDNFGPEEIAGDIRDVHVSEIEPHDVLLAGFPCQPFSLAGVSKKNSLGRTHGFDCQTQGTLFFEIERILRHHRPSAFLLENVKNLRSHDKGNTLKVILRVLREDLDYDVHLDVIDARCFVPQHRERLFIVGFDRRRDFRFDDVKLPSQISWPRLRTALHPEDGTERVEAPFTRGAKGVVDPKYTLSDQLWRYLQAYAAKHRALGNGFGFGLVGPEDVARTLSARYHKDGSEILIMPRRRRDNPRRLTPREASRLMGFEQMRPDWAIQVSDTQAYRQFGNAVVPQVVAAIAQAMAPHLNERATVEERALAA